MSSLLFPIFAFLMHFLAFILWPLVTIWLATSGTENCLMPRTPGGTLNDGVPCDCSKLGTGSEPGCQYINMTRDETRVFAMQAFNLFGFFWMSCFVSGLADMTLAGAFASYYWALNKPKDVPSFPIIRSIGRAIRYHLGTIAFASLILATVKFLRAMLNYLDKKLSAAKNAVAKFILISRYTIENEQCEESGNASGGNSLYSFGSVKMCMLQSALMKECDENPVEDEEQWRPLLIIVPLRLGLTSINRCYLPAIEAFFQLPQCTGIIGGRPNHALYFIGIAGEQEERNGRNYKEFNSQE
uniref:Cysteine protease n=1 Tax=Ascaris lumbricoides TaxID=6252 RepID=A0A0M3INU7_ASCLU